MTMARKFTLFVLIISSLTPLVYGQSLNLDIVSEIPIQDGGRVKPFETFAGESVEMITGRWNFDGQDPVYLVLSFLSYSNWADEPLIKVGYIPLKEELGLPDDRNRFSVNELLNNPKVMQMSDRVSQKSANDQDLTPAENEAAKLMHKIMTFRSIVNGSALTIVPPPPGTPVESDENYYSSIMQPDRYDAETLSQLQDEFKNMLVAFQEKDPLEFEQSSQALASSLRQLNTDPSIYPTVTAIGREIHYNNLKPHMWAWIIYLVAALLFLLNFQFRYQALYWSAYGAAVVGFGFQTWGLLLRSLIAGRPPVSNMYETVIYVGWSILLIALIFEVFQRRRWVGFSGSLVGVGMLIMAHLLPFDSNIEPLVPVLRSNYYLIIHVMSITFSYGAFALAMGLAHFILISYLFWPGKKGLLRELNLFHYRVIQLGVVLLAAGTILGGVWAAESWGRFWGWDPKETWSLISLLGYMAILHARFAGWLRDFGTAVGSIIGFQLILMTWYGVNFVLATGLHSYGFGSGGGWYVAGYLLLETLFLVFVGIRYFMASPTLISQMSDNVTADPQDEVTA